MARHVAILRETRQDVPGPATNAKATTLGLPAARDKPGSDEACAA
jgi:hypothetical protein